MEFVSQSLSIKGGTGVRNGAQSFCKRVHSFCKRVHSFWKVNEKNEYEKKETRHLIKIYALRVQFRKSV